MARENRLMYCDSSYGIMWKLLQKLFLGRSSDLDEPSSI